MTEVDEKKLSLFDRAYGYYRRKQDTAALNVLAKIGAGEQDQPRVLELRAQIFYRQERFADALQLFTKLVRTHSDEFDDIRRANIVAVKTRLQEQQQMAGGGADQVETDQLETFEQQYNTVCHLLAVGGRVPDAAKLIDAAIAECKKALTEDGLSAAEIALEIAPLLAQKAYIAQTLGEKREALKLYTEVLKTKGIDAKVRASVRANLDADFVRYGQKWRPRKEPPSLKRAADDEAMDIDGAAPPAAKKPRKRRPRLPKKPFDPEVAPDPERWLPRQERTAYKKRLNKRMKEREVGRGTQGAAAGSSGGGANIDYSGGGGGTRGSSEQPGSSAHASPKPSPLMGAGPGGEGPRQQRGGGQQAKKKKKGGKW